MNFAEVIDVRSENDLTSDVEATADFDSLMISPHSVKNLIRSGFLRPSPIQARAIPLGLLKLDLLVQAKSGTGKTLVFALLAVEGLNLQLCRPQVLILAPTREIAQQISQTITSIAQPLTRVGVVIGGTKVNEDRECLRRGCHVVVGTVGRIVHMVESRVLDCSNIRLFVLDEADKMMDKTFHKDVNFLFSSLPRAKQIAVFSATYPGKLDQVLNKYMRSPTWVRLDASDVQLIGLLQYVMCCSAMDWSRKIDTLAVLLKTITYSQCIVFVNSHASCIEVTNALQAMQFDVAAMSSTLSQEERLKTLRKLQLFQIRILVTTDLTARGIDAVNVNFIVNLECPVDGETYFHRIGRAGRFGGRGASCTILFGHSDVYKFERLANEKDFHVRYLTENFPSDLCTNQKFWHSLPVMKVVDRCDNLRTNERNGSTRRKVDAVPLKLQGHELQGHDHDEKDVVRYSRSDLVAIREFCFSLSDDLRTHFETLQISLRKSFGDELAELKCLIDAPQKIFVDTASVSSSLPKYVPRRLRSKTKFYLRGELLTIRSSISDVQWRIYAETRLNLDQEPFLMSRTTSSVSNDSSEPLTIEQDLTRIRYSRDSLFARRCSVMKHHWLEYAMLKFGDSINSEPFQLDEELRCPYELQLRIRRSREETEMRNSRTIAHGSSTAPKPSVLLAARIGRKRNTFVSAHSFGDYSISNQKEFIDFQSRANKERTMAGLVPIRRSPEQWNSAVRSAEKILLANRARFERCCQLNLNERIDVDVQCECDDPIEPVSLVEGEPESLVEGEPKSLVVGVSESLVEDARPMVESITEQCDGESERVQRWAKVFSYNESFHRLFSAYINSARRVPFVA